MKLLKSGPVAAEEERQKKRFPETASDIVVIGSVVGRHVSEFSTVYGASKSAVHALAESETSSFLCPAIFKVKKPADYAHCF
jgi:NAD(P)-dependent dehydrogenase (short-subunit alcohol dehydrogenase family)